MKQFFSIIKNAIVNFFTSNSKQVSAPSAEPAQTPQESSSAPAVPTIPPAAPKPAPRTIGVDVSHHNGEVNWAGLKKAGVVHAYIKCTEGVSFFDSRFLDNVKAARAVGILVGAYHFFHPKYDAKVQADYFFSKIKNLNLDLIPDCDWEVHDDVGEQAQVSQIKIFVERIELLTGCRPMIYTGKWFIDEVDALDKKTPLPQWLSQYPLWLSDYSPSSVAVPKPWTSYTLLQMTESGKFSGVDGEFDINWLDLPIETLMASKSNVEKSFLGPIAKASMTALSAIYRA